MHKNTSAVVDPDAETATAGEEKCPMTYALNSISGKWKTMIIYHMKDGQVLRFNHLQKKFPDISKKVLTTHLREMERDGLIIRTVYPVVPPKVEYSLTAAALKLKPILESIHNWGKELLTERGKSENLIGNTPMVKISRMAVNPMTVIYGKMEGHNPGGSVKDRPALWMFRDAEQRGMLKPGVKIIEPTSGNTGIALAMIAAVKGYEIELAMPENSTVERVRAMRAYNAKITLTPAKGSMEAAIDYVNDKLKVNAGEYLMLNQFANPANPLSHYESTGPEIWRDTQGKITHFVSAMGTTGTITGMSRFLKEKNPDIRIIGVQPKEGSQIPGIRRWSGEYIPKIYDPSGIDELIYVSEADAVHTTRQLARREGIFCGTSAGGAMWVALKISETAPPGSMIVSVVCDRGDRYLSSNLFE
ncbi:hypothetical protein CHS0354_001978 [Potamilus streckersoni]|uniref:Cysteine synthase n=1 Tax=Potamilus streckersoni TaxID=2493646 RepID=A0AAE0W7C3_9BIVA|nr:hypothetical protein CHS0354_001978 [Potamilus streckersoni]